MMRRLRRRSVLALRPGVFLLSTLLLAAPQVGAHANPDPGDGADKNASPQAGEQAGAQVAAEASSTNWPSFRGPGARGVLDGPELPDSIDGVDGSNLAWRVEIPGMAHASPVVWGDRIYITSAVGQGPPQRFLAELPDSPESVVDPTPHRWIVMALDKGSGEVLWERTATEGVPSTGRLRKGSFNNSTPATDGEHVVALFGSQGLFCYDSEGSLLWQQDLGVLDAGWFFDPTFQWGTASSPIIWEGKVIVQADVHGGSFIAAFDLADGRELWRTPRDEVSSWSTPTVAVSMGQAEIITNGGRAIRAYDPGSGEQLWSLSPSSEIAVPTPIVAADLIFVGSGYLPTQPFYAVRPGGRGDISLQGNRRAGGQIAWSVTDAGPLIGTPIVVGDYLYLLGRDGTVHCFDVATGIPIFSEKIGGDDEETEVVADEATPAEGGAAVQAGGAAAQAGGGGAQTGGEAGQAAGEATPAAAEPAPVVTYTASPVASNGKLYFITDMGEVHVVDAGPFLRVEATHRIGEAVFATPAISEGMLIVRGQRHLFAFSR